MKHIGHIVTQFSDMMEQELDMRVMRSQNFGVIIILFSDTMEQVLDMKAVMS